MQRQFPDVQFTVQNVQATYTEEQLSGVVRTLAEAIAITGIVMLFFLRSWRSAVVVMIAIPASLLVTLAAMKLLNFTLDTVSLLAMTLIIGILVDDSIVVLENIERHAAEGELPHVAAFNGRSEIGMAALVITLVDVVVFLPISFLPGAVGLFLREFGLVVSVATLTSLFVSFTVTPALAAHWSLASRWKPWKIVDDFTGWFDRSRTWYVDRALDVGACEPPHGDRRLGRVAADLAARDSARMGRIRIHPGVDRGELFLTLTYPTGTPLQTTREGVLAVERTIDAIARRFGRDGARGLVSGQLPGYVSNGAIGQLHIFLKPGRSRSTAQWAAQIPNAGGETRAWRASRRHSGDRNHGRHPAADRRGREHAGGRSDRTGRRSV